MAASAATSLDHPVIDMHLHAYPADFFAMPGMPNPVTGQPSAAATDDAIRDATLEEMERLDITAAVVSGPAEAIERWTAAADGQFIASPLFPFLDHGFPDVEDLRSRIEQGTFSALAEITAQYEGYAPDAPELEPYLALAEELDVPVGLHMGPGPPGINQAGRLPVHCPDYRLANGKPSLLEDVLIRHPNLRIYAMHAGWPYLEDMIATLWIYPQLYVDVGVINWVMPCEAFHRYLEGLVTAGLGQRVMFGSDQMVWPEAIEWAIDSIAAAPFLSEDQKYDILYGNAARFLNLEDARDGDAGHRR